MVRTEFQETLFADTGKGSQNTRHHRTGAHRQDLESVTDTRANVLRLGFEDEERPGVYERVAVRAPEGAEGQDRSPEQPGEVRGQATGGADGAGVLPAVGQAGETAGSDGCDPADPPGTPVWQWF